MRRAYFLSAMLFTAVLCLSGIGLAAAEPQKNQIVVGAECEPDSQMYTFVINGMSKTGHVVPSTDVDVSKVRNVNVVVKQFTVEYYDIPDGNLVGSDVYDSGNKEGLQGDLIYCEGETPDPIELQGLGPVTAIYKFQAFVTPRGKA
jgi:hypothetical protein